MSGREAAGAAQAQAQAQARTPEPRAGRPLVVVAGIVLVAVNLRASITVVGPLLGVVSSDRALSGTAAGLLNTLPLLAFAVFSPLAPRLARRYGAERLLVAAMLLLAAGTLVRSLPAAAALFAGTLLLGAAIAVGNVLLPGVIRQAFPDRVGPLTGLYATTMGLVAALASGVAVPLAGAVPAGWPVALAVWAVPAVVAAAVLVPRAVARPAPDPAASGTGGSGGSGGSGRTPGHRTPWRSATAWQVTAFMGLQSLGFYVLVTWLPAILRAHGVDAAVAGWALALYQVVALVTGLVVPVFTRRHAGHRVAAVTAAGCCLAGYVGLAVEPAAALAWIVLIGAGGGTCLVLALTLIGTRARDQAGTIALSGMAQSIGYLLAAVGPVAIGLLHEVSGGWMLPLVVLAGTAALLAAAGLGAGRPGARVGP